MLFKPCKKEDCRLYFVWEDEYPPIEVKKHTYGSKWKGHSLHACYDGCITCRHFEGFNLYVKRS